MVQGSTLTLLPIGSSYGQDEEQGMLFIQYHQHQIWLKQSLCLLPVLQIIANILGKANVKMMVGAFNLFLSFPNLNRPLILNEGMAFAHPRDVRAVQHVLLHQHHAIMF